MTRPTRLTLLVAATAAAASLAACSAGGDPSTVESPPATSTPGTTPTASATASATSSPSPLGRLVRVTVRNNRVTDGPDRVSVRRGEVVVIVVDSDREDQVHVHGYDLLASVGPGTNAELRFTANRTGIYEVELERAGLLLFALAVQ